MEDLLKVANNFAITLAILNAKTISGFSLVKIMFWSLHLVHRITSPPESLIKLLPFLLQNYKGEIMTENQKVAVVYDSKFYIGQEQSIKHWTTKLKSIISKGQGKVFTPGLNVKMWTLLV